MLEHIPANERPIVLFSNILDISALNAFIIYTSIKPNWNAKKHFRRRLFIEELAMDLVKEETEQRTSQPYSLPAKAVLSNEKRNSVKKARCHMCPNMSNSTKYTNTCKECKKFVCKNHSITDITCTQCKK